MVNRWRDRDDGEDDDDREIDRYIHAYVHTAYIKKRWRIHHRVGNKSQEGTKEEKYIEKQLKEKCNELEKAMWMVIGGFEGKEKGEMM